MTDMMRTFDEMVTDMYAGMMRDIIENSNRMLFDYPGADRVTFPQWRVNLFPNARRRYAAFWRGAQRAEDAVNVLLNGLPEYDDY